jgi:hypothetical protein
MNMTTEPTAASRPRGVPERRTNGRFPLREEASYRIILSKSSPVSGVGETLNMGSGGILFTTREKLPVGRTVEVAVNWPAKLGGTCPLKFVAVGRVVRSEDTHAAVRIQRYEFRTRSMRAEASQPSPVQASR